MFYVYFHLRKKISIAHPYSHERQKIERERVSAYDMRGSWWKFYLPNPDANLADASRLPKPEANLAEAKRLPRPLANFAEAKRLPNPLANLAEANRLPRPLANFADAKRLSYSKESSELKSSTNCSSLLMYKVD